MTTNSQLNIPKGDGNAAHFLNGQGAYTSPASASGFFDQVNVQTITATGAFTYTPTTGTKYAIFELQAGGGGSGGAGGAASQGAVGSGGGAGAYMSLLVSGSANLAAISGSVGVGGNAGTNAPGAGGNGGNTTLTINSGTTWTAGGGVGGNAQAAGAGTNASSITAGGTNTSGTNGTLLLSIPGGSSFQGFIGAAAGFPGINSIGGGSQLGRNTSNSTGNLYGGGALGPANQSGSNVVGYAGGQGVVTVTEFIST